MKPYIKRSQRDYSLSFKLSVVGQIERGELTYTQAAKHYGIQSHSTVRNWLDKHSTLDWRTIGSPTSTSTPMKPHVQTPEQRIKALEVELLAAQQKALLFETIVDIIRKEQPSLVKKVSGKPCITSKATKP